RTPSSAPPPIRSCSTPAGTSGCRAGSGRSSSRRRSAPPVSGATPTRASGRPAASQSSKLMCWVALDRASALAEIRGDLNVAATWRATANEIQADVLAHGVSDRGVLRQHYETDALDASTLLAGSFKFLAHGDRRLRHTVLAVAEELTENGS